MMQWWVKLMVWLTLRAERWKRAWHYVHEQTMIASVSGIIQAFEGVTHRGLMAWTERIIGVTDLTIRRLIRYFSGKTTGVWMYQWVMTQKKRIPCQWNDYQYDKVCIDALILLTITQVICSLHIVNLKSERPLTKIKFVATKIRCRYLGMHSLHHVHMKRLPIKIVSLILIYTLFVARFFHDFKR